MNIPKTNNVDWLVHLTFINLSCLPACVDKRNNCPGWARRGYCKGKYQKFMEANCKKSCKMCG